MKFAKGLNRLLSFTVILLVTLVGASQAGVAQQPKSAATAKPVIYEWVYRTKYGYKDEWFRIFKKYQLAILERQKQLGFVKEYTVYAPSLHTSEDARWDYRIIIVRSSQDAPPGQSEGEVAKQLFPDQAAFTRDENRRWELTTNHWDLPIHVVKLDSTE
ncbi:hypothetical protein SAMN05421771_2393 [Granulicella pectinivorans]|uniref:NIPSNAP protein n=1 Tax=Granulicella pectinivorans TaxID=474950 RepID=A0A1I6MDG0_9BACT|nr:hypothetical protein [Granulicella pectinivorans]SFS13786.1 hypothetical protein SAMN05421771_2393 [Granulicella pectinivorans]